MYHVVINYQEAVQFIAASTTPHATLQ